MGLYISLQITFEANRLQFTIGKDTKLIFKEKGVDVQIVVDMVSGACVKKGQKVSLKVGIVNKETSILILLYW